MASTSQLAQLPIIPVLQAGIGAQFLGMARAAIAVTLDLLRTKVSVDPGTSIRERPSVLADLASYLSAYYRLCALYANHEDWTGKAILNVAGSGKFSSDRTIAEYAADIWHVSPCPVS